MGNGVHWLKIKELSLGDFIMSIEIQMLAAVAGFLLLMTLIQGTRNVLVLGLATTAGNQHGVAPWDGGHDRLNRAIRNLMEAIAIFAPIAIEAGPRSSIFAPEARTDSIAGG